MVGVSSGSVELSDLNVNADLDMGAFDILLDTGQLVDGISLENLGGTGAVVDYVDIADKELDNVATPDDDGDSGTYVNVGTPYTITLADMDEKSHFSKVTLACMIQNQTHSAYTTTVGYNIDGGGDVQIGAHTGMAWTAKSKADVAVAIGEVIQFRLKSDTGIGGIKDMVITQSHAGRRAVTGFG